MPSKIAKGPSTEDSKVPFDPDKFFNDWPKEEAQPLLTPNDFRKFLIKAFDLDIRDDYVYKATAEVTLQQAQRYLEFGGQNGLHAWYKDAENDAVSTNNIIPPSLKLRLMSSTALRVFSETSSFRR